MESTSADLARRVGEIRRERFGEHGASALAVVLGLPTRTWLNYESGVNMPATVILGFVEDTGADPRWLLRRGGGKYRSGADGQSVSLWNHSPSRS